MEVSNSALEFLVRKKDNCGFHVKLLLCEPIHDSLSAIVVMKDHVCKYSLRTDTLLRKLLSGKTKTEIFSKNRNLLSIFLFLLKIH